MNVLLLVEEFCYRVIGGLSVRYDSSVMLPVPSTQSVDTGTHLFYADPTSAKNLKADPVTDPYQIHPLSEL
jgi:hypothetical protein